MTQALLKLHSAGTPSPPVPPHMPTMQTAAGTAGACPTATSSSAAPAPGSYPSVSSPVRGVSTHACTGAELVEGVVHACAAVPMQGGQAEEEQHEYNATRHLLEGVVGAHGMRACLLPLACSLPCYLPCLLAHPAFLAPLLPPLLACPTSVSGSLAPFLACLLACFPTTHCSLLVCLPWAQSSS